MANSLQRERQARLHIVTIPVNIIFINIYLVVLPGSKKTQSFTVDFTKRNDEADFLYLIFSS